MKPPMDNDSLEVAVFTAELMHQKLGDINTLHADQDQLAGLGNAALREAATLAYHQQLDTLCTQLGELATSLPVNEIAAESARLRSITMEPVVAAQTTAQSIREYGGSLAILLPFSADKITEKVGVVTDALEDIEEQELDEDSQARLEKLAVVESALSAISLSPAGDRLLAYFKLHDDSNNQEQLPSLQQHNSPLPLQELVRQLTGSKPRQRLIEYCTAFTGYPVDITVLAEVVYLHDQRDQSKKRHTMETTLNPRQKAGSVTYRELAERRLVLQHGWITREPANSGKTPQKKRVVRSVRATDYSTESHTGNTTDGISQYEWENVGEDELKLALR